MTNAEAQFNKSLRPRKPEGSLGRTAQDGHLDSHTAPELCCSTCSVGHLKCTGTHTYDTAENDGLNQGEGRRIQPCHSRVTIPCDRWPWAFTSVQTAGGCGSSVRNIACCIWNGQVEIDALNRFNRVRLCFLFVCFYLSFFFFFPFFFFFFLFFSFFFFFLSLADVSTIYHFIFK